jgi:hypothetical protein
VFSNTRRAAAPGTLARRAQFAKRKVLSGSHAELISAALRELKAAGARCPWWWAARARPGRPAWRAYTPKDFEVSRIVGDMVDVVADHHGVAAVPCRS